MTLQQLEYIVAVDQHRHFGRAAEACFVTQPTLSMMIQKLEQELNVQLFDRRQQPVAPTTIGREIIEQARRVLAEARRLQELVRERCEEIGGTIRLGIIPTLAPYLLPHFLRRFLRHYPGISLEIEEMTTTSIIEHLRDERLDLGLLVTPLQADGIAEWPLFYERFYVYVSEAEPLFQKQYLLPANLNPSKLWILEEGHCFRSQVLNLCQLRDDRPNGDRLKIEAGSFETVMRLVEHYQGLTVIPELLVLQLSENKRQRVREFADPAPVREVSLVALEHFPRRRVVDALRSVIIDAIPASIRERQGKGQVVGIR